MPRGSRRATRSAYNLVSVASEDLELIRALMLATYREIRTIVSNSRSARQVALINLQLVHFTPADKATR